MSRIRTRDGAGIGAARGHRVTIAVGVGCFVFAVLLLGLVGGVAASDHGAPWPADAEDDIRDAADDDYPYNFTFVPDDPTPGAEGVSYTSYSGSTGPIDGTEGYETMDTIRLFYDEGTINCDADDAAVFGVDRGGNNSGTQVDEDWVQHVKESNYRADRTYVNFFAEGDFAGDPPGIDVDDIVKSRQTNCYDNPEEPGWYYAVSFSNGTVDGEYSETWTRSYPFYICDCEDEDEAREQLGAPPNEQTSDGESVSTPTPTPTPAPETTPTPTPSTEGATPTPTAEPTPTETNAPTDETTPTATVEDDESAGGEQAAGSDERLTPTPGDGSGFGAVAALAGLLVAALLARRRG